MSSVDDFLVLFVMCEHRYSCLLPRACLRTKPPSLLLSSGNPNAYDITTWDPNVDQITFTSEAFFNRDDVKAILHAPTNITVS